MTKIGQWSFSVWIITCTETSNILPLWLANDLPLIVSPYLFETFEKSILSTILGPTLQNQNANIKSRVFHIQKGW